MKNTWKGTIAHVGMITEDNRVVDALFVTLNDGPRPLIDADHQTVVGTVDGVGFSQDRSIQGSGRTSLPPGEYTVGIDLDHVESQENAEGSLLRMTGRLLALHVNRGRPVWPDCKITVEDQ